ncbi:MAG: hypothetical protein AAB884_00830 [Patescibacteria group bacterium]
MRDLGRVGVLGTGGAFARVDQIGYLKAMEEVGIVPFRMLAVSVAALNFAGYLQYGSRGVELIWRGDSNEDSEAYRKSIEGRGSPFIFDLWSFETLLRIFLRRGHIFDNRGLRELIKGFDMQKIVGSSTPLDIVTFNRSTRQPELFSTDSSLIRENPEVLRNIILAAVSPQGIFENVLVQKGPEDKGSYYVDAMAWGVRSLFETGCNTVFVFRSRTHYHRPSAQEWWLSNLFELPDQGSNILFDELLELAALFYKGKIVQFRLDRGVKTLSRIRFRRGDVGRTIDLAYEKGKEVILGL